MMIIQKTYVRMCVGTLRWLPVDKVARNPFNIDDRRVQQLANHLQTRYVYATTIHQCIMVSIFAQHLETSSSVSVLAPKVVLQAATEGGRSLRHRGSEVLHYSV